jgi:hypothetical protein
VEDVEDGNMKKKRLIKLQADFYSSIYGYIKGMVEIRDGIAVYISSKAKFTKKLYQSEIKKHGDLAIWDDKNKAFIQMYPNKKIEEIYKIVRKELMSSGAKVKELNR